MNVEPSFKLCFILFAFLLADCQKTTHESGIDLNSKRAVPPTEVSTIRAGIKPFQYYVLTSGTISSAKEVRMQFARSGIIEKVLVKNGDKIERGQLIAVLINKAQKLGLSKSEIAVHEREIAFKDQMLSYAHFDSTKYKAIGKNVKITTGLAASEVAYEEAKYDFENSFIRAQMDGIVSGIEFNSGSPINEGDLFCYIHDPKDLLVQAEVLESDAMQLANGMTAEVLTLSSTDDFYNGKISNINPRVDIKTGLVKILLKLTGPSMVFPGMHVKVKILIPYNESIIVPKESIVIRSGKSVIFTVVENRAYWNFVQTGRENGSEIEILEGLKDGDRVIISNNLQLAHDAPITVIK